MNNIYENLISKKGKLAVVGLGYVGMPIAVAFAKKIDVIGFDTDKEKTQKYNDGIDVTREVGDDEIKNSAVNFTCDEKSLKEADFVIIAVPTPIKSDNTPDLRPVLGASETVGRNLKKGAVVVYESTVYPGVTEDICIPVLEKMSGLKCGADFKIGYSPERINPGDKVHRLHNIKKIVSGMDAQSLDEIAKVYEIVIEAGVYRASSIKVAEAAKVVENSQRDINIAFMNELSLIFDRMEIDTNEVVDAMNTKWNALGFRPGLVGGHCIGVDPYYLLYKAENMGYNSKIISSGRQVNDSMAEFVSDSAIRELILAGKTVRDCRVGIFGITFKQDCPDIRNSKVYDIIERFEYYGITPIVTDPYADKDDVLREYNVNLSDIKDMKNLDCVVFAVSHKEYEDMTLENINEMFKDSENSEKVLVDVKGIVDKKEAEDYGFRVWRL